MKPKDLIKLGCTCIQSDTTSVFVGIGRAGVVTIYINDKERIILWLDGKVTHVTSQVDLEK